MIAARMNAAIAPTSITTGHEQHDNGDDAASARELVEHLSRHGINLSFNDGVRSLWTFLSSCPPPARATVVPPARSAPHYVPGPWRAGDRGISPVSVSRFLYVGSDELAPLHNASSGAGTKPTTRRAYRHCPFQPFEHLDTPGAEEEDRSEGNPQRGRFYD